MNIRSFSLLTDENIPDGLVENLRNIGFNVLDVKESNQVGTDDERLIKQALNENRIIISQDRDFGKIVYTSGRKFIGIIYLRPGHFTADFHIATFQAIIESELNLIPPFILVASNKDGKIKIRLRNSLNL